MAFSIILMWSFVAIMFAFTLARLITYARKLRYDRRALAGVSVMVLITLVNIIATIYFQIHAIDPFQTETSSLYTPSFFIILLIGFWAFPQPPSYSRTAIKIFTAVAVFYVLFILGAILIQFIHS